MLFMTHEHETHLSGSPLRLNALPPEWGQGLYTIKLQAKQIYSGPGYQKKKIYSGPLLYRKRRKKLFVTFHLLTIVKDFSPKSPTKCSIFDFSEKQTNKKSTAYLAQFLCLPTIRVSRLRGIA